MVLTVVPNIEVLWLDQLSGPPPRNGQSSVAALANGGY
ncbi:hypothetical protein NITLEN_50042 [Nitrospira lenta]|uniref:Uncharacterized protein n=1 Tax=Nitrospira lenta TaxID=1436998 RepID=A0A330LAS0_9BACT|nr:hypothetical protein NITLEN_50042 [Nitrospira lenta]